MNFFKVAFNHSKGVMGRGDGKKGQFRIGRKFRSTIVTSQVRTSLCSLTHNYFRLEQALARRESLDPDSTLNMSNSVESNRGGGRPRLLKDGED